MRKDVNKTKPTTNVRTAPNDTNVCNVLDGEVRKSSNEKSIAYKTDWEILNTFIFNIWSDLKNFELKSFAISFVCILFCSYLIRQIISYSILSYIIANIVTGFLLVVILKKTNHLFWESTIFIYISMSTFRSNVLGETDFELIAFILLGLLFATCIFLGVKIGQMYKKCKK